MWEQYNQYKSIHKQLAKVKPEKREQFEPVSYTHLDVYKRQQSEHIEADFCNTGKEGLQKLKEQEYQLVVLDVMMPCLLYTSSAVAFDLEKLKAFDPKGVAEFRKEWNLPDKKPVKKKNRGMER